MGLTTVQRYCAACDVFVTILITIVKYGDFTVLHMAAVAIWDFFYNSYL